MESSDDILHILLGVIHLLRNFFQFSASATTEFNFFTGFFLRVLAELCRIICTLILMSFMKNLLEDEYIKIT
jgi:hypothetical protein